MYYSVKSRRWALLFVLPFVLCFILFWLAPLVYGIFISLFKWNIASGNNGFVGLDNYKAILTSGTIYNKLFINGLKNTFIFVLLSVPPLVLVSLGLALIINYLPNRWKTVYRTVFFHVLFRLGNRRLRDLFMAVQRQTAGSSIMCSCRPEWTSRYYGSTRSRTPGSRF